MGDKLKSKIEALKVEFPDEEGYPQLIIINLLKKIEANTRK